MATINLGRVKLVNRGTWSSANTYAIDDFVQYTDSGVLSTYIAVAASSNQVPSTGGTENASFWKFMSKGTTVNVGNNKVVTTDGSGNLTGLTIGNTNEVLKVTGANTVGFGIGSKLISLNADTSSTVSTASVSYNSFATWPDLSVAVTPASTSSKFLIMCSLGGENSHTRGASLARNGVRQSTYDNPSGGSSTYHRGFMNFDYDGDSDSTSHQATAFVYDSPATTSQVTYTIQVSYAYSGGGSSTFYFNRTQNTAYSRHISFLAVYEFEGSVTG